MAYYYNPSTGQGTTNPQVAQNVGATRTGSGGG